MIICGTIIKVPGFTRDGKLFVTSLLLLLLLFFYNNTLGMTLQFFIMVKKTSRTVIFEK